jgi:hypothetical protein
VKRHPSALESARVDLHKLNEENESQLAPDSLEAGYSRD